MINLQKLQGMGFKEANIAPYGNCIIVPGDKFDPDWEAELGDQGHKCFETLLNMKPVTLVQVEKKPASSENAEKVVYSPPAKLPEVKKERGWKLRELRHEDAWTVEEDAYLIELQSKGDLTYREVADRIHVKFPRRSLNAVSNRIFKLQKDGKLKQKYPQKSPRNRKTSKKGPGKKDRKKIEKKDPVEKTKEIPNSVPTEIPTSTPTSIPTDAPITKDPVVQLLEEIRDLLAPPDYSFDYFCQNCGERGNVSDSETVYEFCPVCGKPLIIWNVEASA